MGNFAEYFGIAPAPIRDLAIFFNFTKKQLVLSKLVVFVSTMDTMYSVFKLEGCYFNFGSYFKHHFVMQRCHGFYSVNSMLCIKVEFNNDMLKIKNGTRASYQCAVNRLKSNVLLATVGTCYYVNLI